MIVPVSKAQAEYATQVEAKLRLAGFFADADVCHASGLDV